MAAATDIAAGLADPVHDAQAVFRAVLEAMARPGMQQRIGVATLSPKPLSPLLDAVALTLLDQDVTTWLSPALAAHLAVREHLVFHTGVRISTSPDAANFILCASPAEIPPLGKLAQGTPEYPDRSATVVVDCAPAKRGDVAARLSGPGIESSVGLSLPGFDRALWRQLQDNHRAYPLGVDLIVCAGDGVIGLPRSTRIEVA